MCCRAFESLPTALLATMVCVALYTDLRFGKIYNRLTVSCIALGIGLGFVNNGLAGVLSSLGGAGLILALFVFFAPKSGIGGGDVKMLMAVGAIMGLPFAVWALLFTGVIGGMAATVVMVSHGAPFQTLRGIWTNLFVRIVFRNSAEVSAGSRGLKFRYSPAIAIGCMLALWVAPR